MTSILKSILPCGPGCATTRPYWLSPCNERKKCVYNNLSSNAIEENNSVFVDDDDDWRIRYTVYTLTIHITHKCVYGNFVHFEVNGIDWMAQMLVAAGAGEEKAEDADGGSNNEINSIWIGTYDREIVRRGTGWKLTMTTEDRAKKDDENGYLWKIITHFIILWYARS